MTSRIKNKEEAFLILKYQRERGALPVGSYEVMKKKKQFIGKPTLLLDRI